MPTLVVLCHMHWARERRNHISTGWVELGNRGRTRLTVVAKVGKVALANLLAVVLGSLVHPAVGSVGVGVLVRAGLGPAPEEVLALVRSLVALGVLHVADVLGQVVSPLLGLLAELLVPLERLEVLALAAVVLDLETLLLIGSHFGAWGLGEGWE